PVRTADPTTQCPARSCGANPPAMPKLIMPAAPRLTAASRAPASCDAGLQTTATPGPSATRASSANEVTAITAPLPDIVVFRADYAPGNITGVNRCAGTFHQNGPIINGACGEKFTDNAVRLSRLTRREQARGYA